MTVKYKRQDPNQVVAVAQPPEISQKTKYLKNFNQIPFTKSTSPEIQNYYTHYNYNKKMSRNIHLLIN